MWDFYKDRPKTSGSVRALGAVSSPCIPTYTHYLPEPVQDVRFHSAKPRKATKPSYSVVNYPYELASKYGMDNLSIGRQRCVSSLDIKQNPYDYDIKNPANSIGWNMEDDRKSPVNIENEQVDNSTGQLQYRFKRSPIPCYSDSQLAVKLADEYCTNNCADITAANPHAAVTVTVPSPKAPYPLKSPGPPKPPTPPLFPKTPFPKNSDDSDEEKINPYAGPFCPNPDYCCAHKHLRIDRSGRQSPNTFVKPITPEKKVVFIPEPKMRNGKLGAEWRHIKSCYTPIGSHVVWIDGSVKQYENEAFPLIPPKDNFPIFVRGKRRNLDNIFHRHAKEGFKYWDTWQKKNQNYSNNNRRDCKNRHHWLGVGSGDNLAAYCQPVILY